MKKIISLLLVLLLLASAFVLTQAEEVSSTGKMEVGYSRKDITPYDPVPLAGYANPSSRKCESARDNLYASCTAIRDGEGNIALIFALDLHGMEPSFANYMQKMISQYTDVPEANIALNCSHNHAAPEISSLDTTPEDFAYRKKLISNIIGAATSAIKDLSVCTEVLAGTIKTEGLNFIRRYVTDENGNVSHEINSDGEMPTIRFVRENAKDIIMVNWAAHCDTISGGNWHAAASDYIGPFRDYVEAKDGDAYLSVLMGAAGDVNPVSKIAEDNTYFGTIQYGRSLARALLDGLDSLTPMGTECSVSSVEATYRATIDHSRDGEADAARAALEAYNKAGKVTDEVRELGFSSIYEINSVLGKAQSGALRTMEFSAISIGDTVFVCAPYEMFTETGRGIKEASPFRMTFICAYTNGQMGYIPTEDVFENGGYEVYSCSFVPGTAEDIESVCASMVNSLVR